MPAGTTNLSTMRVALAQRMHDYLAGVTTAGSDQTAFRDSEGLTEGDGWWTAGWIQVTGALANTLNINVIKRIKSYMQASQMGTIWGTFPQSLAASTSYGLYRLIEPAEYTRALNEAARMCYPQLYRYIEDESVTIQANTWAYTVPSLMRDLAQVWYQVNVSETTYPYAELEGCTLQENGQLRLPALPPVGNKLRLIGIGPLTDSLSADADIIEVDRERLEPLYWAAESYLWDYLSKTSPASESERYERSRKDALGMWGLSLKQKAMQPPGFRVQVDHSSSW